MDGTPATRALTSAKNPDAEARGSEGEVLNIARIMHAIPHRYPFLMIDRVIDVLPPLVEKLRSLTTVGGRK